MDCSSPLRLFVPVLLLSIAASARGSTDSATRQACGATRSPDLCESALAPIAPSLPPNVSGTYMTLVPISKSIRDLLRSSAQIQAILESSDSNVNRSIIARNCLQFLDYSNRRLSAVGEILTAGDIPTARTFASAAQIYQYGCWAGLTRVKDTQQVVDAAAFLGELVNMTGYATAMVTALQRYGENISRWGPPQTERDGYWPVATPGGGWNARRKFMPPDTPANATVCKSGGGSAYTTVQAAVDAAPENSSMPFVIRITAGVYEETVRVGFDKTNIVFIGDGMGKTVITGNLSADTPGVTTYSSATVGVNGDGFMARDLTIANTAGPDAHQAVAFSSDSDRSVLESVEFLGHQDTLYAQTLRQFFNSCRISGTVDFIFGNSASIFSNCLIFVVPRLLEPERGDVNTVTAHGRTDPAHPTGFVFDRCVVNGSEEYLALYQANPRAHMVYLGRPWKEYSRTVFINSHMAEIVRPEGWLPWRGDFALQTLYLGEFESTGPGANATARVPWSSQIPKEHLGVYSFDNFIQCDEWCPGC